MTMATPDIDTLSLHDALPISANSITIGRRALGRNRCHARSARTDRKSTRLNSSHLGISYAGFCLKKKKILTARSRPVKAGAAVLVRLLHIHVRISAVQPGQLP